MQRVFGTNNTDRAYPDYTLTLSDLKAQCFEKETD